MNYYDWEPYPARAYDAPKLPTPRRPPTPEERARARARAKAARAARRKNRG